MNYEQRVREMIVTNIGGWDPDYQPLVDAIAAAQAENERLREALKPFADAANRTRGTGTEWTLGITQNWELNSHTGLTYGDLEQARAALAPPDAAKGSEV